MPDARILHLPHLVREIGGIERFDVVLADVQRMTSTLVTALANGADRAYVFDSPEKVREAAARFPKERILLGGERHRVRIEGFDRDNSPRAYLDGVAGKLLFFTTTNGAKALEEVRGAKRLFLGAFLNISALARRLCKARGKKDDILIVCSGTEGYRAVEDEVFAGMLLDRLEREHGYMARDRNTQEILSRVRGLLAGDRWRALIRRTRNAKGLLRVNLGEDLDFCERTDLYQVAPVYRKKGGYFAV